MRGYQVSSDNYENRIIGTATLLVTTLKQPPTAFTFLEVERCGGAGQGTQESGVYYSGTTADGNLSTIWSLFARADRQYNHSYLNLSRHRGKPATTERPNCHNRELKHGAILYNEAEVFSLSIGTLRKTRRQRQRHQTKGLMSRTMAVHVRYNSLYISLPYPVKQPILRCLKNVNYDG